MWFTVCNEEYWFQLLSALTSVAESLLPISLRLALPILPSWFKSQLHKRVNAGKLIIKCCEFCFGHVIYFLDARKVFCIGRLTLRFLMADSRIRSENEGEPLSHGWKKQLIVNIYIYRWPVYSWMRALPWPLTAFNCVVPDSSADVPKKIILNCSGIFTLYDCRWLIPIVGHLGIANTEGNLKSWKKVP